MIRININDVFLLIATNLYEVPFSSIVSLSLLIALVVLLLLARSNKKASQKKDLLLQTALEIEMRLISKQDFDQTLVESFKTLGKVYKLRAISLIRLQQLESYPQVISCWDSRGDAESNLSINKPKLETYILNTMNQGESLQLFKDDDSLEYNGEPIKELTLLPIQQNKKTWGFIAFIDTEKRNTIKASECTILTILSRSIGALLEKKNTQDELSLAKDNAEAADQAKSEFLAIMSHEIRTPMNAIVGFADVLGETELDMDQQEYVKIMTRSCHDLLNLLNDILDYSHIESRQQELKSEPFNLEILIVEVLDLVLGKAKEKKLELDYSFKNNVYGPTLLGDHMRLRQVLINIVSNAIKFTHEGFVKVFVDLEEKMDGLWGINIEVQDTGIGIPDEALDLIFNPFTQADTSSTRKYGGVGLGLAICNRIINKMKGKLSVVSNVDQGSCFRVELELQATTDESSQKPDGFADSGFSAQNPLSLLLVQDENNEFEVLLENLQKIGYCPDIATSLSEFIEKVSLASYDCLLLDVKTSSFDAIQITQEIRSSGYRGHNKDSYIIGMTSLAVPEEKALCEESGMNEYISKPLDIPKLKINLAKAYQWHQSTS